MNASKLEALLETAIKNKLRVLIVGPPGCGKTAIVSQVCRKLATPLVYMHPAVSDPTDFKGLPGIVDGKAEFLAYGDMRKLASVKERTVVFADDVGQAPFSVQASMMQPIHGGRINGHILSDELVWLAATNDTTHMAGVQGVIEPLKSRFHTIVHLKPSVEDWTIWAGQNGMPFEVIAYLNKFPDHLSEFKPSRELKNSPCPRNWEAVGRWINSGIRSNEVIAGAIGETHAAQFSTLLGKLGKIPDLDDCIARPTKAEVPDEGHIKYAVVSGIANKATKKNFGACLEYVERLGKPFEVLFIKLSMKIHSDKITECPGFVKWTAVERNLELATGLKA